MKTLDKYELTNNEKKVMSYVMAKLRGQIVRKRLALDREEEWADKVETYVNSRLEKP